MPDDIRPDDPARWGRPTRRKSRGPKPAAAEGGAPAVGPIDDPLPGDAATIVRLAPSNGANPFTSRREPDTTDERLRDLVVYIARGLVDRPDDVSVNYLSLSPTETSLELRVHPDDIGHVIGKLGRTARSVRLMLGAAAAKADRRANLEIAD